MKPFTGLLRFFVTAALLSTPVIVLTAESRTPMPPRLDLAIPDGEYLTYNVYQSGEKIAWVKFVTRYISSNIIKVYCTGTFPISGKPVIGIEKITNHYTNFGQYYTINLLTGSMIRMEYDSTSLAVTNQWKGNIAGYYKFGTNTEYMLKTYDGYEMREQKSIFRGIDTSLPCWDQLEFQYAVRVLDVEKQGYLNQFIFILKNPIVVSMKKVMDEKIETPIGTYNTDKFMYGIGLKPGFGDRVLMNLMKSYIDSFYYYVDKSPSHRLIKFEDRMHDSYWILTKSEIWK